MAGRAVRGGMTSRARSLRRQGRRLLPWTPISPAHVVIAEQTKRTVPAGAARSCEWSYSMLNDSRCDSRHADSTLQPDDPGSRALHGDHKNLLLVAAGRLADRRRSRMLGGLRGGVKRAHLGLVRREPGPVDPVQHVATDL